MPPSATGKESGIGPVVPDITDHNETDEGRELEAEIEQLNKEAQEARGKGKSAITFLKYSEPWTDFEPDDEDQYPPREYVWDGESSFVSFVGGKWTNAMLSVVRKSTRASHTLLKVTARY